MLAFTVLCLLFSLVHAIPLVSREVFDPPITSPDASTVWTVGQTVTVTWDTSNLPPDSQLTNPNGQIVLGFMANDTDSEHLMLDSPLAQNFKLSAGRVSFSVPSVVTRNDYIVVLFGDSGNRSPRFTIQGSAASSETASSTSSASSVSFPVSSTTITSDRSNTASPPITTTDISVSVTSTLTGVVTTIATSPVSTTHASSSPVSTFSTVSSSSLSSSGSASSAADSSSNGAWKAKPGQAYAILIAGLLLSQLL